MNDYTIDDVIYLYFTTRAFATGIPTVLAGSPTLEIYENDSATPIVEGASKLVLGVSHNSIAGFNLATVTLSAASGFENGKSYTLMIKTGTVATVSVVGEVVGEFTIGRHAATVDLANGTDGLGAIKGDTAAVKTKTDFLPSVTAGGAGGVFIAGTNAATTVTTSFTTTFTGNLTGSVDSVTGDTKQTADHTAGIADIPTVAEFNARTILSADYFDPGVDVVANVTLVDTTTTNTDMLAATSIVSAGAITTLSGAVVNVDLTDTLTTYTGNTPQTADHTAGIADIPTVAEFNARTLVAASYFDPTADAVANVTLCATTTTNTDMRGTDGANTVVPDAAGTAATPAEVNAEVLDVLTVDTFTEATTVPAATSTIKDKLNFVFAMLRNKTTQTSTTKTLRNDADSADIASATVSDDATTFTKGEFS